MPGAVTDLYDVSRELLEACAQALALTPGGAIDRAYVSPGVPAWDCEQLTVHAGGPVVADTAPLQPPLQPGRRIEEVGMVNLVTITATVIRCCVPGPEAEGQTIYFPPAEDLDAVAKVILADCWAIWNHVATLKRAGTLWPPKTRELFFDPAVAVGASGGCAGWQMQMRVQLDGFRTL
jgi:hypothetical protein